MFSFRKIDFDRKDLKSVIDACIAGSNQAQQTLFRSHYGFVKSVCLRYCASDFEVDEVVNESFLKIFQNLNRYDSNQPFKAWIRTIAVNTAISNFRKYQKHNVSVVGYDDLPIVSMDDSVLESITADEILSLVNKIHSSYRIVFLMHAVDGYSHKEIAQMLDLNEVTVRSRYMRTRSKLQVLIKSHWPYLFSDTPDLKILNSNDE